MRKTRTKPQTNQDSLLIKAATTIGKAAGKVAGWISPDKTTEGEISRKRQPASKKLQRTVRKKVATKKSARKGKGARLRSTPK